MIHRCDRCGVLITNISACKNYMDECFHDHLGIDQVSLIEAVLKTYDYSLLCDECSTHIINNLDQAYTQFWAAVNSAKLGPQ